MGDDVKIFFSSLNVSSYSCSHCHSFVYLGLAFFLVDVGGRKSVSGSATLEKSFTKRL